MNSKANYAKYELYKDIKNQEIRKNREIKLKYFKQSKDTIFGLIIGGKPKINNKIIC